MNKILPNIEEITERYNEFASKQLNEIKETMKDIRPSDLDSVSLKLPHGISMANALKQTAIKSNLFNETYYNSFAVDGALHDVGRFDQFKKIGNLVDADLKQKTGINDHGKLGKQILLDNNSSLLKTFIKESRIYDYALTEIISEHAYNSNSNYSSPQFTKFFSNYELEEILKSSDINIKNKLIALKIRLLQEVDGLEMFQNIVSGAWKPAISGEIKDRIHKKVWELFIAGEEINISKLREEGQWNCNDGVVLRYGLLVNKCNIVAILKQIQEDDYISKILKRANENCTNDHDEPCLVNEPLIEGAAAYTDIAINNLIKYSDDYFVTLESRKIAREKTIGEWKKIEDRYR